MIWFELFPGHSALWWIWTALGVSSHLRVHSVLLSVWNMVVSHFPCCRLCQWAHSECSRPMELFGIPWPEDMECSRCENYRFFMDHCFFCSIFKIICLPVHQFLRTFQSVYITYNFEEKFHASELIISLGIWNEMKKVEKEKHFYEEILKIIKKNIIKILIVDIFPLQFFFFPGYKSNAIYKRWEDIENIIMCCLIIKYL